MPVTFPSKRVLGIAFFDGTPAEAVTHICEHGGVVVVPAAPALANIQRDAEYRRALLAADLAIADSGFMVLLCRYLRGRKIRRISGLKYLETLLGIETVRARAFLILPSRAAEEKALRWWKSSGRGPIDCYVAPVYGPRVEDARLVALLDGSRPDHVIIGVGGGTQEKLGLYLRDHLGYRPAIHCIGAALGFLTGDQKPIPAWADSLYLGWLLRLVRDPRLYARRFSRAFELPALIYRYGDELPPLKVES